MTDGSTDVYFIGYDSTQDEVMLSAAYIARIIREICPEPPADLFKIRFKKDTYKLRGDTTKYESLDLVVTRLGAWSYVLHYWNFCARDLLQPTLLTSQQYPASTSSLATQGCVYSPQRKVALALRG